MLNILFFIAIFLTGCAPTPTEVLKVEPVKPTEVVRQKKLTNAQLAHHVNIEINNDDNLHAHTTIRIVAQGRKVIMLGQSPSLDYIDKAQEIVYQHPQVEEVINYVTIQPPIKPSQRAIDIAINTQISQLMRKNGLLADGQSIEVENQVAYVIGKDVLASFDQIEASIQKMDDTITIIPVSL